MKTPFANLHAVEQDYQDRLKRLNELFFDKNVEVTGDLDKAGISIGVAGEAPLAEVVPCLNPKVKCPIGFLQIDGTFRLVNYILREDVAYLRTGGRGSKELNLIGVVNEVLNLKRDYETIAYGQRGSRITITGRGEVTFGFDSTVVARIYSEEAVSGAVDVCYRGKWYSVVLPYANNTNAPENAFKAFAYGIVPSIHSYLWNDESKALQRVAM